MDLANAVSTATTAIGLTVLDVEPMNSGKLFALATVEIEIDGVAIIVHGVQALRCDPAGTRVELPKFRDRTGIWRSAGRYVSLLSLSSKDSLPQ